MSRDIMVIEKKELFPKDKEYFNGFISAEKANNLGLYSIIWKNLIPMNKKQAENNLLRFRNLLTY